MDPKRPLRRRCAERGFMIVTVAFLVLVIGAISVGFLQEGLGERTSVSHHETSLHALEIAQVGLFKAEMELMGQVDVDADGMGTVSGVYGGGTYEVTAVRDDDHRDVWRLTARGVHGHSTRRVTEGLRVPVRGYFKYALFGDVGVTVGVAPLSDAYDSGLGSYASQAVNSDAHGTYALAEAHVGSNGDIGVDGVVRGDARPGTTGATTVGPSGHVTGDTTPRTEAQELPILPYSEFEDARQHNENALLNTGDPGITYDPVNYTLAISGANLVMPAGTYFFTDMTMNTSSTLTVTGEARVYVTGSIKFNGGTLLNTTLLPENLVVLGHPYAIPAGHAFGTRGIKLNGGSAAACAVYAPALDVFLTGNANLFGAIVGRTVTVSGSGVIHYDQALAEWPGGCECQPERIFWHENADRRR